MGAQQWTDTYGSELSADISPAMVDMVGSVRSKIFSIVKIVERDGDKYEAANRHYKILLNELPTEDRVSWSEANMTIRRRRRVNRIEG